MWFHGVNRALTPEPWHLKRQYDFFLAIIFILTHVTNPGELSPFTSHHEDVLEQAVSRWHHLRPDKSPKHPLH